MVYLSAMVGCFLRGKKNKINNKMQLHFKSEIERFNYGLSQGESSRLSKMAVEPTREWSDERLKSDDLPKKDLIKFIQDNAAHSVCVSIWCLCSGNLE